MSEFNEEFPEDFNWCVLDSPTLASFGEELALKIKRELKRERPEERHLVPGLRKALCIAYKYGR